ncbi:MAG: molybdopterin oxidoreductase [Clostridiales bacterium GWB2_37_7]|nr:MAG: molybdopterin oxidoreductase [Clostridiales bacterium GWB2_37_7]
MEVKDMVCIVCPLGCKLKVIKNDTSQTGYTVEGNKCFRGVDYGIKEMSSPTRVLTTTVIISDASVKRLPVRTSGTIPKHLIKQAMELINKVEVKAPIIVGQVIIKNILDTGVDIIASRSLYQDSKDEETLKGYLVQG